jgi:hypothetical protein
MILLLLLRRKIAFFRTALTGIAAAALSLGILALLLARLECMVLTAA